ncbi:MAG: hypothetical protein NZL98_05450 [Anaerolineales bacterium]|nr:hypothetical protein [Anaerolineales bacterium]MDW8227106.1 hypothetical protein [Anaerolineales bacterium]
MRIPTEPPHTLNGWTYRLRPAQREPARLALMLHGWTGDENSMWFFAERMASDFTVLLPRAPYPVAEGGYSWREMRPGTWGFPVFEDLRPAAEMLMCFLDDWKTVSGADFFTFDVVGFSQGGALAYTLGMLFPERVRRIAALAGFLPLGAEAHLTALAGKEVFIAHGRDDELVSVERARTASRILAEVGVRLHYCETEGGHKVGRECVKALERFFANE